MKWQDLLKDDGSATVEVVPVDPEKENIQRAWDVAEATTRARIKALDPVADPEAFEQALLLYIALHPVEQAAKWRELLTRQALEYKALAEELERTRPARAEALTKAEITAWEKTYLYAGGITERDAAN